MVRVDEEGNVYEATACIMNPKIRNFRKFGAKSKKVVNLWDASFNFVG
jgi:hypothetical protein